MDDIIISRFDLVTIRTTKNVSYLSADTCEKVDPNGTWSVLAILGRDLLLCKKKAVIRIPASDVLLFHKYDIKSVIDSLGKPNDQEVRKTEESDEP